MKLSKVNSKYGAPMGRGGLPPDLFATRAFGEGAKVKLAQVRINCGGYDNGGAYWGLGLPLYRAYFYDNGEATECFFRASSRSMAKKQLLEYEPELKFYR